MIVCVYTYIQSSLIRVQVAWLTGCAFIGFATFSKFVNTTSTRSVFSGHFFPMFTFQIDTGMPLMCVMCVC
jgi:hypothetical protein